MSILFMHFFQKILNFSNLFYINKKYQYIRAEKDFQSQNKIMRKNLAFCKNLCYNHQAIKNC